MPDPPHAADKPSFPRSSTGRSTSCAPATRCWPARKGGSSLRPPRGRCGSRSDTRRQRWPPARACVALSLSLHSAHAPARPNPIAPARPRRAGCGWGSAGVWGCACSGGAVESQLMPHPQPALGLSARQSAAAAASGRRRPSNRCGDAGCSGAPPPLYALSRCALSAVNYGPARHASPDGTGD